MSGGINRLAIVWEVKNRPQNSRFFRCGYRQIGYNCWST